MMKNCFLILLLSTALLACNQSAQKQNVNDTTRQAADTGATKTSPADRLITPGRSIGRILLNENVANVSGLLGRPDSSDAAMGSSLMVWYAHHKASGYRTSVFAHRKMGTKDEIISRIQKILITSPEFKTAEGLGVGSAMDAIKKYYDLSPTSDYKNKDGKVQAYTDMNKGISFEIDVNNKCVGVVVHQIHDTAAAYLDMH
ncbi:hypothetical protein [Mucilaginibacter sp. SP1R1]|uniref:hypothetical protein n=1 Tax=Mucilaginibacter sp. SP1R1 TaxID=2723091 RepID=UPI00160D1DF8|nr:hypothetical protein [Mucilaginibacter sp. SP1R1]MBB6152479.1 hypothetical protein [Mucilaginibacter sp. SP1R1]